MDRRAVFTPVFAEFLATQQRQVCEERTQRRYRGTDGSVKYTGTEWKPIMAPSYVEEVMPQTLTEDDLKNDRWPAPIYQFRLENGTTIESRVQESRDFPAMNLRLDFMTLVKVMPNGDRVQIEEFDWNREEMNDYLPQGRRGNNQNTPKVLEVLEPQAV